MQVDIITNFNNMECHKIALNYCNAGIDLQIA